jgi:hypothetical protein
MTEQGDQIARIIQAKNEDALKEAVSEVLHRQPTAIEWTIAMTSFFIGGCCVADAMIEGLEEHNVIKRN